MNDHCLVRAPDGRWHVFGITKATPEIDPHEERWFCHGSGTSLAGGRFREHGRVCDFGTRAWAPSVAFDGERWVMLYGPDRLRAAVCDDPRLDDWHEVPCSLVGAPIGAVLRDGMIFRLDDDTWLLYATGKRGREGAVSVCVSENLLDWRFVRFALRTTADGAEAAALGGDGVALRLRARRRLLALDHLHDEHGRARRLPRHAALPLGNPFDFGSYGGTRARGRRPASRPTRPSTSVDPDTGRWYVTSAGWPGDYLRDRHPGQRRDPRARLGGMTEFRGPA